MAATTPTPRDLFAGSNHTMDSADKPRKVEPVAQAPEAWLVTTLRATHHTAVIARKRSRRGDPGVCFANIKALCALWIATAFGLAMTVGLVAFQEELDSTGCWVKL